MNRRSVAAVAAIALLSPVPTFAQAVPSTQQVRMVDMDVNLRGFRQRVFLDTMALWQDVSGTPAVVFRSVIHVLDSLKIPYTHTDSTHGLIWNDGFTARNSLVGKPISTSLRCGYGPTGDYADHWRVSMAYAVYVLPSKSDRTRLGVALIGVAKDMEGTNKPAVQCSTTGVLEDQVTKLAGR